MKNLFFLVVTALFFLSCETIENSDNVTPSLDKYTVIYGQSFGYCIGKCHQQITLNGTKIEFLVKERSIGGSPEIIEKFNETLPQTTINSISKALNEKTFFELKEVYGCPDCADGGMEWIEIINNKDQKHKVTFESGSKVEGIEDLILLLRAEKERLNKKYIKQE